MENGIPYDPEYVFHDVRVSFFRNLKVLEVTLLRKKFICMHDHSCLYLYNFCLFDFINFYVLRVGHFSVNQGILQNLK